jgi:hypothetical protein
MAANINWLACACGKWWRLRLPAISWPGRSGAGHKGIFVVASKTVEVGQRYRIVREGGVPSGLWEVTRVYMPWYGGIEHACIKSIAGRSETMTLATSVIADKSRFVPES